MLNACKLSSVRLEIAVSTAEPLMVFQTIFLLKINKSIFRCTGNLCTKFRIRIGPNDPVHMESDPTIAWQQWGRVLLYPNCLTGVRLTGSIRIILQLYSINVYIACQPSPSLVYNIKSSFFCTFCKWIRHCTLANSGWPASIAR